MTLGKRVPVLCTSHGADLFSLKGRIATVVKKLVFKKSDFITVVSNAMREETLRFGVASEKIDVIPMGVDMLSDFTPDSDKRDRNTVVFVGRLVEKKGLTYLLEAFSLVLETNVDSRLVIAGAGPEENVLKKQASDLGIITKVEFLGAVQNDELSDFYQRAAIAVFPFVIAADGDQEGFGLVVVEALGCGCAVIASEVPAVRDILNGENGLLVSQRDSQQLAAAIVKLMQDDELCLKLSKKGRAMALEKFGWNGIAKRYNSRLSMLVSSKQLDG
jgi:glycosyltransferase involved in cell wall biosynthesis